MLDLFSQNAVRPPIIDAAVRAYAEAGHEERGAVYTRREVVDFILDLNGYTADTDLARRRLLEPSIGEGEFLLAAVERLLTSYLAHGGSPGNAARDLAGAICAVELHAASAAVARRRVADVLVREGLDDAGAAELVGGWIVQDDFLLAELEGPFHHVVGNPPYVRQEAIPAVLIDEYRRLYETIYDRADLYVPFIERGLRLLAPGGALTFICSDRWVKNRYGGPLRGLVASEYRLRHFIDMTDTPAFAGEVIAYPAVFTVERPHGAAGGEVTLIAERPAVEREALRSLAVAMTGGETGDGAPVPDERVHPVAGAVSGKEPWLLNRPDELVLLRRLERELPALEEVGLRVGIGVATGADNVFIRPMHELDIEEERRLPLALAGDIDAGVFRWSGKAVLNPFEEDGSLADFAAYPRFAAYLLRHEGALRKRHVAKRDARRWYRTIDRIWPLLTGQPKLLIPDIKGSATVAYDAGTAYPHHNLYYVVAEEGRVGWDLRALQAVLRSTVAEFFVASYSIRMRGGFLRFQAQYLRRIRVPAWADVPPSLRERLVEAASADRGACNAAAFELYGISEGEGRLVQEAVGAAGSAR